MGGTLWVTADKGGADQTQMSEIGDQKSETSASAEATASKSNVDAVSDAVKALVGLDGGEHDYNSLEAAIHELSKELSADDVAALREMLTWPNDKFPEGMRDIEINAVKNDVLDRLLRQTELPEGIGLQMTEMAFDPGNDPVWRDYCIQFMQPFYERRSKVLMSKGYRRLPACLQVRGACRMQAVRGRAYKMQAVRKSWRRFGRQCSRHWKSGTARLPGRR